MVKIKDAPKIKDTHYFKDILTITLEPCGIFKQLKSKHSTTEWLQALTNNEVFALDVEILTKYGERRLNSIGQMADSNTLGTEHGQMEDIIWLLHSTEWDRLWASYVADYNPIWNVDGTESETQTRDLEANHTGTDAIAHAGTITDAKTGTDTLAKTGTDTTTKTGTESTDRTGTDTYAKTGTERYVADIDKTGSVTETGTDTNVKTGTETLAQTGTVTNTGTEQTANGVYGFNSNAAVPSETTTRTPNLTETRNLQDQTTYNTTDTETKNLSTTTSDTEDADNTTTYNVTDLNTKNLEDETTYNTTDRETLALQDQTTYASTNTQTHANSDTETKNLKDTDEGTITIERERHGNIGVTMTQQLLEADREYWTNIKSLFFQTVINDIMSEITYKIYVA